MKFELSLVALFAASVFADAGDCDCDKTSFVLNGTTVNPYCYKDSDCKYVLQEGGVKHDVNATCDEANHICSCSAGYTNVNGFCVSNGDIFTSVRTVIHLPQLNLTNTDDVLKTHLRASIENSAKNQVPSGTLRTQTRVDEVKLFSQDDIFVYDTYAPARYHDEILANVEGDLNTYYNRTLINLRGNQVTRGSCPVDYALETVAVSRCQCWATLCRQGYLHLKTSNPTRWLCHKDDDDDGWQGEEIAGVVIACLLVCCLLCLLAICGAGCGAAAKNIIIDPEPSLAEFRGVVPAAGAAVSGPVITHKNEPLAEDLDFTPASGQVNYATGGGASYTGGNYSTGGAATSGGVVTTTNYATGGGAGYTGGNYSTGGAATSGGVVTTTSTTNVLNPPTVGVNGGTSTYTTNLGGVSYTTTGGR